MLDLNLNHNISKIILSFFPKNYSTFFSSEQVKKFRLDYIQKEYSSLQKSQWFKLRDIEKLQLKKLKAYVSFVYYNIPFYRRKFREIGVTPYDINSLKDLEKIPI